MTRSARRRPEHCTRRRSEAGQRPAERLLYFALVGALEAGLVRTAEDALTVLQASRPLGPMGAAALRMLGEGIS